MKRVIAWVLLLTLCLGLFAGCRKNEENPTTGSVSVVDTTDLEAALEYVKTVYKKVSEKTPKDFTRIGNVPVNGVNYEVVWSVDVDEEYIKIVKGTDGMVTIDVNEEVKEDVKYVLTATITDNAGNSVSHSWNHLLPAATGDMVAIVEEAYALEPGESMSYEVTLTGVITMINTPWSDDYKNITVTIAVEGAEDKPVQCYRLTGDGAKDLKIGDTITVTGTLKNYNGTIEFDAGCTLDDVVAGEEVKAPSDPKQIVDEAYALGANESLKYEATLTGKITKIKDEYSDTYKNITVIMVVEGRESKPITCYRLKGQGAADLDVGDTITVKGYITNYVGSSGYSTIEFTAGCQLVSYQNTGVRVEEPKVEYSKVPKVVENPEVGTAYKLYMNQAKRNEDLYFAGSMNGYYLATVKDPNKATDVYLEAVSGGYHLYFMDGSTKKYVDIQASGTHMNATITTAPTATLVLNTAIKGLTATVGGKAYYMGTYDRYSTIGASPLSYITEDMSTMDTKNFVARLAVLEDKVVETPAEPEVEKTAAQIVDEAFALEKDAQIDGTTALTGVITYIDTAYSEKYSNITVSMVVPERPNKAILCYRMTGDGIADLAVGDTITVEGTLVKDTEGVVTMEEGCELKGVTAGSGAAFTAPETDAEVLAAAKALEESNALPYVASQSGVISEVVYEYSDYYDNITVIITTADGTEIYCKNMGGKGVDDLIVGDTITASGILYNAEGQLQFKAGCQMTAVTRIERPAEDKFFVPKVVETPETGKAYKFFLYQAKLGKNLYFNGALNAQGYYLGVTEDYTEAVDVYIEDASAATGVTGAVRFYFLNEEEEKVYIETFKSGNYVNNRLVKEATMYYVYNETAKTYTVTLGEKVYYLGTFGENALIRASETKYIINDNAANVGVSQFVAQFGTLAPAAQTVEPAEPPVEFEKPYKYFLYQAKLEKALYFNGALNSQGYYLGVTDDFNEAVDVYVEDASAATGVTGAVRFYFLNEEEEKVYIETFKSGNYVNNRLVKEATMYYVYNETAKTYTVTLGEKVYYLGTFGENALIRASETKYIINDNAANVGVSQFVAQFGTIAVKEVAPAVVETPAAETAYKFFLYQAKLGKNLYFNGALNAQGYYLGVTEDYTEAVDVYIEDASVATGVTGAVRFYFLNEEEEKVYIETFKSGNYVNNRLVKEATMYYVYNETAKTYTVTLGEKVYYLGTFGENALIRASETKYIINDNAANVGVSQFVACFAEIVFVEDLEPIQ